MSDTTTLILSGSGYELSIAPEAEAQKAELLKDSALIVEVRDPSSGDAARNQIKKLAAMRNAVEKSRKLVKEPVLKVGRDIDAKAAEFVAELAAEEKRLAGHLSDYAAEVERERLRVLREMEEKRRAEEAERQRIEAERVRAENERIAAERAAEEAKRKANEAFLAEDDDGGKAEREAREAAEQAARAQAEAARLAAEQALAARSAAFVAPAPEKVGGVKFDWDYEITDIHQLYLHNAGLVTLTERRKEIIDRIKGMAVGDEAPVIPGLRAFKKPVVSTR